MEEEQEWERLRCILVLAEGICQVSLVAQMVKNLLGDSSLIPESGKSPGEGNGIQFQYSGLENSKDRPWGHKELDMTE